MLQLDSRLVILFVS